MIVEGLTCGCTITLQDGLVFCPLHKAAQEMLKKLHIALPFIPADTFTGNEREDIIAVIAKAEGR